MKVIISFFACFLLLTGCGSSGYKTINENEATDLLENNAIIIDVRNSDKYESGHIKDAINIPVDNISSIDYDKDTVIILYCDTGIISANAAKILVDEGYTNVYNLDGGLINWGAQLEE